MCIRDRARLATINNAIVRNLKFVMLSPHFAAAKLSLNGGVGKLAVAALFENFAPLPPRHTDG